MTATYPTDVIFDVNTFPVLGTITYTNTGLETNFNMAGTAQERADVLVFTEGILQETVSYSLANSGATVAFASAPNVSNLTIKNVSVPANLKKFFETDVTTRAVSYSNTSPVTINSNTYLINGTRTAWSLPSNLIASSKESLIVAISGVQQVDDSYTFPSATLGGVGIDISPALTATDTLHIRMFLTGGTEHVNDRCRDLGDRKPDKGYTTDTAINVLNFESQVGYEVRRLISRRKRRTWKLTYTNISGTEKQALQTFYDHRGGEYETFFFDLTHVNETASTALVRFEGPLKVVHNFSKGTGLNDNFYTIEVTLKETY
jgi:hypothetical protein